ncbi:MAG: bifunctional alpha,alpha-trehalose-phosphate synthase (UDP-forming)/trehalose-phosphatase [Microbacteriaceae bacterium]|nr:bifunctional alpha,alpha-trehalose-phosphate synthase (UDP-forming)/trehalose-phosphatase [Microbacteriaceae bacterium]
MPKWQDIIGGREIVVVANRLPVDRVIDDDGTVRWQPSPGGLVTAMEPIVRELGCTWVGWTGDIGTHTEPFTEGAMRLVPVELTEDEFEGYYEGFSNSTLWPLYHDVIAQPEYHREWWEHYWQVNQRFAEAAAQAAPQDAIVWVHDYQLQLVPRMLREMRPDLTIAFFLHIPFPARMLFAQLPWRREITKGLLGADVIGFQREQDAASFRTAAERYGEAPAHGNLLLLQSEEPANARSVLAQEFPISIDVAGFTELAARPEVQARATEIRRELGDPRHIMLGVDRLDYTKGIRHRLKAFAELLADGEIEAADTVLVQVASPSRERVSAYRQLRDDVESTVGRINGDHGSIGRTPVVYLHQGYAKDEMAALYLAADVLVVTALRDGMNLVAKEYVACRADEQGVLVLSEFTGAADELQRALLVNPHDIERMKAAFVRAIHMPEQEQRRRMRALRDTVERNDVQHWAENVLRAAAAAAAQRMHLTSADGPHADGGPTILSRHLVGQLRRLATSHELIVACDFDGTLAPIVSHPEDARIMPRAQRALDVLSAAPDVHVTIVTGRSIDNLRDTGISVSGFTVSGSHGIELLHAAQHAGHAVPDSGEYQADPLSADETERLTTLQRRVTRLFNREQGVRIEMKPYGLAVHTRRVRDEERSDELLDAATRVMEEAGFAVRNGKRVRECSLRTSDKGSALRRIRAQWPSAPVLFLGDDVTDEDVFAALRVDDLGIKVGLGDTAATERVADPAEATAVLATLAELRNGVVIGTKTETEH